MLASLIARGVAPLFQRFFGDHLASFSASRELIFRHIAIDVRHELGIEVRIYRDKWDPSLFQARTDAETPIGSLALMMTTSTPLVMSV